MLPAIRKTGRYEAAPRFDIPQTLPQALRRVRGSSALSAGFAPAPSSAPDRQGDPALFREVARDLLRALPMWEPGPASYLMRRGLSREVVVEAAHRGLLRMLPTNPSRALELYLQAGGGAQRLAQAGLWAGQSPRWPANVFRPLLFFAPDCSTIEFRCIAKDSRYP
ncbi:MAG: hypothetical protein N2690_13230, partial [Rhodocyclaceae bacterium]|nr:hypothetical protein [Rhodocyclaceae bacterium]